MSVTGTGAVAESELWLSVVEFDALWELLGLGERPSVLALPSPGRTADERRRLLAGVLDQLRSRGLAPRGPGRRPHRWVAELLDVLARPRHLLDLHLGSERIDERVALAGVAGERAALAGRHGDQVWVVRMSAASVVAAMVDMLGPVGAGVGRPVTVPADCLDAACRTAAADPGGSLWTVADQLCALGVTRQDAASLARAYTGIRSVAQFSTTGIIEGRRHPGPWTVGVHQTASGHFSTVRRPGPAGTDVTIAPTDPLRLNRQLTELLRATR